MSSSRAIAKVLPPLAITSQLLTSTTVAEPHAPADYNAGTTYGKGAFVTDATLKDVYESLQASNTGNTPASSPLWWRRVGVKEVAWSNVTGYLASTDAAPVYVLYDHRLYEAVQAGTDKNPYANPDYWQDIGPSLRYAMFDTLRNTASIAASPLVVVITPGQRIDSLAVLGVIADSVRVEVTSAAVTVYDETIQLLKHPCSNWYEYFFKGFVQNNSWLFQNIPPFTDAVITVTFTKASGNVVCGAIATGIAEFLGYTQKNAGAELFNYSTIAEDDFGNSILQQKRTIPKTALPIFVDSGRVTDVMAVGKSLNAVPAVWFGLSDSEADYFPVLLILGVYTKFAMGLPNAKHALLSVDLKEV